MPLNLVAVFDVGWQAEDDLPVFSVSHVDCPINTPCNEKRVLIRAFNWVNFRLSRNGPHLILADLPQWDFAAATANQQKLIIQFKPRDIKNCILTQSQSTFSSKTATVFSTGPSIALIWVAPLPTTPKLAPLPTAKMASLCGDHFRFVKDVGSFAPNCLIDFYIYSNKQSTVQWHHLNLKCKNASNV